MDVYYKENMWGKGKQGNKLTARPVNQTFFWGKQEIFIPAVYVGKAGAALDICAKISTEEMAAFLKKWDKERRLSLQTPEDYEQIEADNPSCRNFAVEMSLDGTPLVRRMSSSLNWYPIEVFQMGNDNPESEEEWKNDKVADKLMVSYGRDRQSCWHFARISYDWHEEANLTPQSISLAFQSDLVPVTAGHFTTSDSCNGETMTIVHPATGQEYTLTLHECAQTHNSFADIGMKGVVYPEYCQTLSYSISPEISRDLFDIRDCGEGDHPRMGDSSTDSDKSQCATAVFMAQKTAIPNSRMAVSSMHFEPVTEIRWRIVFMTKAKDDLTIDLSIRIHA